MDRPRRCNTQGSGRIHLATHNLRGLFHRSFAAMCPQTLLSGQTGGHCRKKCSPDPPATWLNRQAQDETAGENMVALNSMARAQWSRAVTCNKNPRLRRVLLLFHRRLSERAMGWPATVRCRRRVARGSLRPADCLWHARSLRLWRILPTNCFTSFHWLPLCKIGSAHSYGLSHIMQERGEGGSACKGYPTKAPQVYLYM